jgi:hypothetical protein
MDEKNYKRQYQGVKEHQLEIGVSVNEYIFFHNRNLFNNR